VGTITGHISPKSVTATGTGLVSAQNMMYTHTITVYDRDGALVKTIPDSVSLASFGVTGHPGESRGAPVEAAVDPAHKYLYASNYSMYGANFGPEGSDNCSGPSGLSRSFVYRVKLSTLAIDGVAEVGMVPKYVAVTPDNRYVLVSNWCSYDLSVVDRATFKEVRRIPLGAYPRGIAVDSSGRVAYVAIMGSYNVARIDLSSFAVTLFRGVGSSPRHLVLSPDGRRLFVTLNGDNRVVAVDTSSGAVVARTLTGTQPRSMAISADGQALYVVNYESNTVSILRSSDLSVVRTFPVPDHPIGITYEPTAHRLWVACYSGEILVYDA
jgi:YVTN family beta-propeller protein